MAEFILEDLIWRNALAVIPLALIAAVICRFLPCRPTTRHALWLIVLLSLMVPPMLPRPSAQGRIPVFAYPLLANAARYASEASAWLDSPREIGQDDREFLSLREHVPGELAAWLVNPRSEHIDVVQRLSPDARETRRDGRQTERTASRLEDQVSPAMQRGGSTSRSRSTMVSTGLFDASTDVANAVAASHRGEPLPPIGRNGGDQRDRITSPVSSRWYNPGRNFVSSSDANPTLELAAHSDDTHDETQTAAAVDNATPLLTNQQVTPYVSAQSSTLLPSWMTAVGSQLASWMNQLGRVRDAVAAIPPPPFAAWLAGLALLLVALIGRATRYRRVIRAAEPAPFDVQMLVQRIAKEMDLRRVPDVRMLDACVAPMVWCGAQPRLILPTQLWSELDLIGRRTVICHELAHIRRRDHWVCRIDLIIGLLYWWHPVVWFVRRRIREEAEYCCDAWVTSMLPSGRRAYAQALLQTRTYTAGAQPAPNALALAVATPQPAHATHTRRFARRIAMVMTQRHRPGMTLQGLLLVCGLGVMGYVAAPMVACPPDEKKKEQSPEPSEMVIPAVGADRVDLAPEADDDGLTTFEQFMMQQNGEQPEPDQDTQQDIQEIEQRIERLQDRIGELLDSIEAPQPPGALRIEIPDAPAIDRQMLYQDALRRALETIEVEYDDCTPSRARRVTGCRDNCTPSRSRRVTHRDNCTPSRARRVTVRHDNCTPNRGNVLSFTVTTTDSDDTITRAYYMSGGKLRDLTRLMARSDVPVWITRHNDRIEVQGTPAQHQVFESFVRLIESGEARGTTVYSIPATGSMNEAVNLSYINAIEAQANRGCTTEDVRTVETQVQSLQERSRSFQVQSQEIERYAEQLRRQAEQVRRQAERLEQQFEEQQDQIEEVEHRARKLDDLKRFNLMSEAHVLLASAQTVRSESSRLNSYADLLDDQADLYDDQADNASDQSDRYEDLADELRDLAERYRERE